MKGEVEQVGVTPSARASSFAQGASSTAPVTRFPPYLNASAKATLPGSTEQVPREVQPGEQHRFRGAQHQQEAKDGSRRAK